MTKRLLSLALLLVVCAIPPALAGPLEDGLAAYKKGDFDVAVSLLRPLAEQGNAQAEEKLGRMYQRGRGVAKDFQRAVDWYRKAAEQGDAAAQGRLGFLYRVGAGVPRDLKLAMKWYRQAAEQGNPLVHAETIRAAFALAASGARDSEIARLLNDRGLPVVSVKNGAKVTYWQPFRIGRLLANRAYLGERIYNRRSYKAYRRGEKASLANPKEVWVVKEKAHEAIIEQDLFDRAKRAKEELAKQMTAAQIAEAERLAQAKMPK